MEKKSKAKNKKKESPTPKVSYHYKPDNMTLEQWQIALRQQTALKETFVISEDKATDGPGYYIVSNPTTRNEYRVVFRGEESPWNYCSCMDFKTSRLGTCKHNVQPILPCICRIVENAMCVSVLVPTMKKNSVSWQNLILLLMV